MGDLVLCLAVTAAGLGLGLDRFVVARHGVASAATRHAAGFAYVLSAAMVLLAPPTEALVARAGLPLGLADLPDLLGDVLRCATACQLQLLAGAIALPFRAELHRGAARRRLALAAVVVATMCGLYSAAGIRLQDGDQQAVAGRAWLLAGYDALVTGYVSACLVVLALGLARRARAVGPGPLRTGLRLLFTSTLVGLVWTAWGVDDVVDAARTGAQSCAEDHVSALLGAGCLGLLVATAATVLLGRLRAGWRNWYADYRRYRVLAPLWAALHRAYPEIVLMRTPGPLPPRNARLALYRRVIEIHDARLLLRRHIDEECAERVRRAVQDGTTPPARVDSTVEAAILATALVRARTGPPTESRAGWTGTAVGAVPAELDSEAEWLGRVSRAFVRSAEVADIRRGAEGPQ